MWDLPRPGIELISLALQGRFLIHGPPGKSPISFLKMTFFSFFSRNFLLKWVIVSGHIKYFHSKLVFVSASLFLRNICWNWNIYCELQELPLGWMLFVWQIHHPILPKGKILSISHGTNLNRLMQAWPIRFHEKNVFTHSNNSLRL